MSGSSIDLPIEYKLENGQINNMHAEFLGLVKYVKETSGKDFVSAFESLVEHIEKQLAEKNDWMKASRFPEYEIYAAEHWKLVTEVKTMLFKAEKGDLTLAKKWVDENALEWFINHFLRVDKALSDHLQSLGASKNSKAGVQNTDKKLEEPSL